MPFLNRYSIFLTCDYIVDKQNTLNDIHYFWPASPFRMQVSLCCRQHNSLWCQITCTHIQYSKKKFQLKLPPNANIHRCVVCVVSRLCYIRVLAHIIWLGKCK